MELRKNRYLFWVILFFLTIFLHLLLLWLLLFIEFAQHEDNKLNFVQFINQDLPQQNSPFSTNQGLTIPQIDTDELAPEDIAAMKAKKTNLGVPIAEIENDEEPEVLEMSEDAQKEETKLVKEEIKKDILEKKTIEENLAYPSTGLGTTAITKEEVKEIAPSNGLITEIVKHIKTNKEETPKAQSLLEKLKNTPDEFDEIKPEPKEKETEEKKIENLKQGIRGKKKKGIMNRLMADKRKKVIPGLANFIGPEGEDLINRPGNENLKPTQEDIKKASYINKVTYLIQNAWRIKQNKLNSSFANTTLGVSITIDKSGKITNLFVTKSTGYKIIDDLMLETIEYAAPFPPIPKHLNQEIFIYNPMIYIYMQSPLDPAGKYHLI